MWRETPTNSLLYDMNEQNNHDKPSEEHYNEVKDTNFLTQKSLYWAYFNHGYIGAAKLRYCPTSELFKMSALESRKEIHLKTTVINYTY